jgi:exosortase
MTPAAGLAALVLAVLTLYGETLLGLVRQWQHDDNYSHGFLIVPAAAWMVWRDRQALAALPRRPASVGLFVVLASLLVLFIGTLGAELFLTRVSMLGVLAGGILFLLGFPHLRRLAFPLGVLLLMIPLPAIVFNQIAFPLQILASQLGVAALRVGGIPVLREGNVIVLASTTLEVAEACSGIRSLISLLTLGVLYGYISGYRPLRRTLLALATIPIAIVSNAIRVAGAGVTADLFGPAAVEGFLHSFSGWLTFVSSLVLLLGVDQLWTVAQRLSQRHVGSTELAGS